MLATTPILMDIDQHSALPFPHSLPEFQRLFPNDAACAKYLERRTGAMASSVRTAVRLENRSALRPVPECWFAGNAVVRQV
jgi:hypothetical protein